MPYYGTDSLTVTINTVFSCLVLFVSVRWLLIYLALQYPAPAIPNPAKFETRSSATADRPSDAICQSKSH